LLLAEGLPRSLAQAGSVRPAPQRWRLRYLRSKAPVLHLRHCRRCGRLLAICCSCDHGYRYGSRACSDAARHEQRREAKRRQTVRARTRSSVSRQHRRAGRGSARLPVAWRAPLSSESGGRWRVLSPSTSFRGHVTLPVCTAEKIRILLDPRERALVRFLLIVEELCDHSRL